MLMIRTGNICYKITYMELISYLSYMIIYVIITSGAYYILYMFPVRIIITLITRFFCINLYKMKFKDIIIVSKLQTLQTLNYQIKFYKSFFQITYIK